MSQARNHRITHQRNLLASENLELLGCHDGGVAGERVREVDNPGKCSECGAGAVDPV